MATKRRQKANAYTAKLRREYQKRTGKKLPETKEYHHKTRVKKGGKNRRSDVVLITRKRHREIHARKK